MELLIVIVVIGILAAISIVAYNGIQERARVTSIKADLTNASKQLANLNTINGTYPSGVSTLNNGAPMSVSAGNNATYTVSGGSYCLIVTNGTSIYNSTDLNPSPSAGSCVANNRALNPSIEDSVAAWKTNSNVTLARTDVHAADGIYSLKIDTPGGGGDRYVYTNIPVIGGIQQQVNVRVYLEAAGVTDYNRGIWLDDQTPSGPSAYRTYNTSVLSSWQTISVALTPSIGATVIQVRCYVMPGSSVYIDELRVIPG